MVVRPSKTQLKSTVTHPSTNRA